MYCVVFFNAVSCLLWYVVFIPIEIENREIKHKESFFFYFISHTKKYSDAVHLLHPLEHMSNSLTQGTAVVSVRLTALKTGS